MTEPSAVGVPRDVRLVVADVDGTLVTPDKIVTPRARSVIRRIVGMGIGFTITSGRPPRGMKMLIDELQLQDPITAFNGGVIARPDLSIIREQLVPGVTAQPVVDILTRHELEVWVYDEKDWYVTSPQGLHVEREQRTVKFPPIVVPTYEGLLDRVVKMVGVSDDEKAMARCATEMQQRFGHHMSVSLSQPYYLDVTHPDANKGKAISVLSALLDIPVAQIATIGDMPNDVLMFRNSGLSIAMGNADADVQHAATFVTTSNTDEGFALAMERFVLKAQTAELRCDRGAPLLRCGKDFP